VQYARRIVGGGCTAGKAPPAPEGEHRGVIPPIFASSILLFPATIANFITHPLRRRSPTPDAGRFAYESLYVAFIIFFCYFYTAVTFNPVDVAENMKKYGDSSPGSGRGRRRRNTSTRSSPGSPWAGPYTWPSSAFSPASSSPVQRPLLLRGTGS